MNKQILNKMMYFKKMKIIQKIKKKIKNLDLQRMKIMKSIEMRMKRFTKILNQK